MNRQTNTKLSNSDMEQVLRMPHAEKGQRIGLFGGSFNPPHAGHVLVSKIALRRLELDQIWWMVTPGNPIKDQSDLAPLATRIGQCRKIARHPAVRITAFEKNYSSRYTVDTLDVVLQRNAGVKFVWVMGADSLATFHHWQHWRQIADMLPMAVIDRPGSTLSSRSSKAALALARFRVDESDAFLLADMGSPAWSFIHGPRSSLSSTGLRNGEH